MILLLLTAVLFDDIIYNVILSYSKMKSCEDEKLHLIGGIQGGSESYLVVVSGDLGAIIAYSKNSPSDVTTTMFHPELEDTVKKMRKDQTRSYFKSNIGDVTICKESSGYYILEIDPYTIDNPSGLSVIINAIDRSGLSGTPLEMACDACKDMYNLLEGYDRAMVYCFNDDFSGDVVFEIKEDHVESSYMGLRFPSTDIPKIARDLYIKNTVRVIKDSSIGQIDIVGEDVKIDLSNARLRAVSKYHLAYMKNMGVRSSMSVAIVVDEKLWGLFAFHAFAKEFSPDMYKRITCDVLAKTVSKSIENEVHMESIGRTRKLADLISRTSPVISMVTFLRQNHQNLLLITKTDAMCVWIDGELLNFGDESLFPPSDFWKTSFKDDDGIYASDSNSSGKTRGFARFDTGKHRFAFFRSSILKKIRWGGKADEIIDGVVQPRKIFDVIDQESVEYYPWMPDDIKVLDWIKEKIIDMITRNDFDSLKNGINEVNDECANAMRAANDRDIFATMSHELRTPFHGVLGCVQAIEDNLLDSMERITESIDLTRTSKKSGESMLRLLNDILMSSKTSHNLEYEKQVCKISNLVLDSISTMNAYASTNGIKLEQVIGENVQVCLDKRRFGHTLTNLVNNAIKFTPSGGKIIIRSELSKSIEDVWTECTNDSFSYDFTIYPDENGFPVESSDILEKMRKVKGSVLWASVSVVDSGCGIETEESLSFIFREYKQGNTGIQRTHGGTGLGLYICTSHLSHMNGFICCSSTPKKGTSVRLIFPVDSVHMDEQDRNDRSSSTDDLSTNVDKVEFEKGVILLVDDSPIALKLLKRTIKKTFPDVEVLEAEDGINAMTICHELLSKGMNVKLMITDFHMPRMSGEQLISKMKILFPHSNVIAYTADARSDAITALSGAGADEVLVKPVLSKEMILCIRKIMKF